jgi:hypothetical protein
MAQGHFGRTFVSCTGGRRIVNRSLCRHMAWIVYIPIYRYNYLHT